MGWGKGFVKSEKENQKVLILGLTSILTILLYTNISPLIHPPKSKGELLDPQQIFKRAVMEQCVLSVGSQGQILKGNVILVTDFETHMVVVVKEQVSRTLTKQKHHLVDYVLKIRTSVEKAT